MTHVRFNNGGCVPSGSHYPGSNAMINWFRNDFENEFKERTHVLANIIETKDDFRIELAAPGFARNEFKINLEDQILTISGEAQASTDKKEENFLRHEFGQKAFSRSFRLSNWVDSGSIQAKLENGILTVTIPKVEEAKSKPAQEINID
jgi:HSP20 family protein